MCLWIVEVSGALWWLRAGTTRISLDNAIACADCFVQAVSKYVLLNTLLDFGSAFNKLAVKLTWAHI